MTWVPRPRRRPDVAETTWSAGRRSLQQRRPGAGTRQPPGRSGSAGPAPPSLPPRLTFLGYVTFTDIDGHRFQLIVTDLDDDDIAYLEALYRGRGRAERAICDAKDLGLANLPSASFAINQAWLAIVGMAQDLLAWARHLTLDGDLARAEPKTAPLLPPACRRPARHQQPAPHTPHRRGLALGRRSRRRLRPAPRPTAPSLNPATRDHRRSQPKPRRPTRDPHDPRSMRPGAPSPKPTEPLPAGPTPTARPPGLLKGPG
jgi:hypothetical protein